MKEKLLQYKNEQVKLHLDIDENQNEAEAYWFNYAPPSVNIMYSMPLVGEKCKTLFSK